STLNTPPNQTSGGLSLPGPVVGVYIADDVGAKGFARWTLPDKSNPRLAQYVFAVHPTAGSLHINVGCGGTPQRWTFNVRGETSTVGGYVTWHCEKRSLVSFTCAPEGG